MVPVNQTSNSPRSRIKIEFANVSSHDSKPLTVNATPGLVYIQDVILNERRRMKFLQTRRLARNSRTTREVAAKQGPVSMNLQKTRQRRRLTPR